ncbi:MAG: phosphotransferase [Chloroflexota bacterium]|nr:phosphotransferase [Chloroflexota bacterium]
MDGTGAEAWIRRYVEPVGPLETTHQRPWATVLRVPLADGVAWFKACGQVQAFEPRLTAELFRRWPGLVSEVLAYHEERSWLLLADAGTPIGVPNNTPEAWLSVLPRYAELQRGETAHALDHLEHGVPDMQAVRLPERYEELLRHDLPLEGEEIARLRRFARRFGELCHELGAHNLPDTVQHDDPHAGNLYPQGERLRLLDWDDASISHPFASLVLTFRFLEELNRLPPADPWFARLRDAYLEPWGQGLTRTFDLAMRVGAFAHAMSWVRQREALPEKAVAPFDTGFQIVLRRAIAQAGSAFHIRNA